MVPPYNSLVAQIFIFFFASSPVSHWQILSVKSLKISLYLFLLFRAAPTVYGSSLARDRIRAATAGLHHSHSNAKIRAMSVIYTTGHSYTGSLTHWVRPGSEPTSSWILVRFLTAEPRWEILKISLHPSIFLYFQLLLPWSSILWLVLQNQLLLSF